LPHLYPCFIMLFFGIIRRKRRWLETKGFQQIRWTNRGMNSLGRKIGLTGGETNVGRFEMDGFAFPQVRRGEVWSGS